MGWLNRALTSTFISGCRQREPVVSTARIEDLPASAGPVTHAEGMRSAKNVALDHMPDVSVTEAGWQLPDDFRMAIYIAGFEGFGFREIAGIMQCQASTVLSRLHRGRSRLASFSLKRAG